MNLETTLNSLPGIFYVLDRDGCFVKWNRNFEQVSGYSAKELSGMNALDLFNGHDKELIAARIGEVFKTGSSDAEADFVSKDGKATPYYFSGNAITTNGVTQLVGMGIDITARRKAEEKLTDQNTFLHAIIESLPYPFYVINPADYTIRMANHASGWNGVACGTTCHELTHHNPQPCGSEKHPCPVDLVLETGKTAVAEHIHFDLEDNPRIMEVHAHPVFDSKGKLINVIEYSLDVTEPKQMMASLRESEEKFRTIFEKSPIGIEMYDARGVQIATNRTSLDMFGIENDSSIGFNLFSGTSLTEELKQQLQKGNPITYQASFDFERVRQLGQYQTTRKGQAEMEYWITPLSSLNTGDRLGYLLQVREVTERKKGEKIQHVLYNIANAALVTRDVKELIGIIHTQVGTLVDTTNFYVAFYDEQSGMLTTPFAKDQMDSLSSWPAEKSMTGYVIQQDKPVLITSNEIPDMLHAGIIEMVGAPAACWLGVPLRMEGQIIGALVVQSYDNPGAYTEKDMEILVFVSDLVSLSLQRKKIEISLLESEERFRKLTESATDAIVSIDTEGRILLFNHAAERLFGYSAREVHLRTVDLLIPERYGSIFMKWIQRYLESGSSTILGQTFEFRGRDKGGNIFPLELSLSEVKVGGKINFIGIVRDITARKQAQTEIETFAKALKESNATKDKFFSIIAHDLKSPFNAILGLTKALIHDYRNLDEKRIQELLKTIQTSSERAFDLLENLLAWANTQTGQVVYRPSVMNLCTLIDENMALMEGSAANKGIRMIPAMKEDCMVFCDRQMIMTVLRNLIHNAVKFTPFGGEIIVSVGRDGDQVVTSVRDSGIGIAEKDLVKLFRIETKYSTRGTGDEKGTGLGLILCKEFIEKHGGKIWAESEEGKGSTFRFTLPEGRGR